MSAMKARDRQSLHGKNDSITIDIKTQTIIKNIDS